MRNIALIAAAVAATVPGTALRWGWYVLPDPGMSAAIFGVAIIGAAFVLSWAAEVLQLDVSQGRFYQDGRS